jgi:nucleoside-diphosphate-sugar epimerase
MDSDGKKIKVIVTGATGMVGEGVLLECLRHPAVETVLSVGRKPYGMTHPKLRELVVPDFMELSGVAGELAGYDGCFFCAGVSSRGMKEEEYSRISYDVTLNFARTLVGLNPGMVFDYVSGAMTDGSEKGRIMWARVKGRTENALGRLGFRAEYNFRPGFMKPVEGQRNIKGYYKLITWLYPVLAVVAPSQGCTLEEVGSAMINSVLKGYSKPVLEISDIKALAKA